jgi:hypothetical protein
MPVPSRLASAFFALTISAVLATRVGAQVNARTITDPDVSADRGGSGNR